MKPPADANLFDIVAGWIATALNPQASRIERGAAARRLGALGSDALQRLTMDPDWQFVAGVLSREISTDAEAWEEAPPGAPMPTTQPPEADATFAASGATAHWHDFTRDRKQLLLDDSQDDLPQLRIPCAADSEAGTIVAACASAAIAPIEATAECARRLPWATFSPMWVLLNMARRWPTRGDMQQAFWAGVLDDRAVQRGLPRRLAMAALWAIGQDGAPWEWFVGCWDGIRDILDRETHDLLPIEGYAALHLRLRVEVARRARDYEIIQPRLLAVTSLLATSAMMRRASEIDMMSAWEAAKGDPTQALRILEDADREQHLQLSIERAVHATNLIPSARQWNDLSAGDREAIRFVGQRLARAPEFATHGVLDLRDSESF